MKKHMKSTAAFGIALSMLGAPLAMAQQYQHDDNQGEQHMAPVQHQQMQHEPVQHEPMQHQTMQHEQRPPQHQQMAQAHHWQHGQHYSGSRRVVGNWSHYHLRQPPHGYEWVQDGSQFVLIGVASGIIADVLLNSAYH
jgi:Ni/Co efflux regulator RcnB